MFNEEKLNEAIYKLAINLEKEFGKLISVDIINKKDNFIECEYRNSKIRLYYREGEYLKLVTDYSSKYILNEIYSFVKTYMNSNDPICNYDIKFQGNYISSNMEWNLKEPDKRISDIVNGRVYDKNYKVCNIEIYGNRNINDYIENNDDTKIYGIYPGIFENEEDKINNLDEIDLFFLINELGGMLWRNKHDMADGRIEYTDLSLIEYSLEYAVYLTTKYGVELEKPQLGKHVKATESYNAWFNFYYYHFNYVLTNSEWRLFNKNKEEGKSVTEFLPKGTWKDSLKKNKEKILN